MSDIQQYADRLTVTDPLREPIVRAALETLQPRRGSRGLDVGCGVGTQALALAKAIGPQGHVTGLDISPAFLSRAEDAAKKAGLSERTAFREGDLSALPFDDASFDWLWSADCAGYPTQNPQALLRELSRVVKPGGILSMLVWSWQMLLPGYPRLEARLNATSAGIAPFRQGMMAEHHHLRALGWFHDAGLCGCSVHTLVGSFHAPLSAEIREAFVALFEMRWPGAEAEVSSEDWQEYQRLCQPTSPDCVLDRPDYYAFVAESLFCGRVAPQ